MRGVPPTADACSRILEDGEQNVLDECRGSIKSNLTTVMPHLSLAPYAICPASDPAQYCNRIPSVSTIVSVDMSALGARRRGECVDVYFTQNMLCYAA